MECARIHPALVAAAFALFVTACSDGSSSESEHGAHDGRLLISDIEFADQALRSCVVEAAIENEWIYVDEVQVIECFEGEVASLEGLEVFAETPGSNLRELHLYNTTTADLTPLTGFTSLVRLTLRGFRAVDISPLASLLDLDELVLRGFSDGSGVGCAAYAGVADLSILADLTNLKLLHLEGCFATEDYAVVSNLINLEALSFWGNETLKELPHLADLTKLRILNLTGCTRLSDIGEIAILNRLRELYLAGDAVKAGLQPISSLQELRLLRIHDSYIDDISPLSAVASLEVLTLVWQELDFEPQGKIFDISPLAELENLSHVQLEHQMITDVSPLAALPKLQELKLTDNRISDISSLNDATNLEVLVIDENVLTAVPNLGMLSKLHTLSLNDNRIEDISELSALTSLSTLSLNTNRIIDLIPLAQLHDVSSLQLDSNRFLELWPLLEMAGLERLSLKNTIFPCSERDHFIAMRPDVHVDWGSRCQ
tara:strand:+ start:155 stop:1612 length:1458 start_codon:yes stop_codon:yes gene_type:complete